MTTKDDERKALQQIKKIIEGLGKDSYVGTAIDQMILDLAEDNINNDFLSSPAEMIKSREEAEAKARIKAQEAAEKLESMKASRDEWQRKAEREERKLAEHCKDNREYIDKLSKELEEARRNCNENAETVVAQAAEIITLKAKLYDLMTK